VTATAVPAARVVAGPPPRRLTLPAAQWLRRAGIGLFILVAAAFLLGPLVITLFESFSPSQFLVFPPGGFSLTWYGNVATDTQWTSAAWTSLRASLLVALFATLIGVPAAYALSRGNRWWHRVSATVLLLPLVTPTMILSLGISLLCLTINLAGTLTGLVLAQSVLALPFVIVNNMVSFRDLDQNLIRAGRSLGASPLRVFLHVVFPLIRRGLLAGAMFAFLASWDDAVIALFLVGPGFTTLPVQLLNSLQDGISPAIAAVGGYLTLVAVLAVSLASVVQRGTRRGATVAVIEEVA
jgi:ABC-type spermidine/putrescine transport system permease subunit II